MDPRTRTLGPVAALAALLALPAALAAQQAGGPPAPAAETELVFEREVFQYPSFQRMNPFVPLDAGAGGPRFEQLSLIGVVYAGPGGRSVAVLSTGGVTVNQDGTISPRAGEAFYLRAGERLGNVTVVEVRPDMVVVDVEEFGLTDRRTIELVSRREGGTE